MSIHNMVITTYVANLTNKLWTNIEGMVCVLSYVIVGCSSDTLSFQPPSADGDCFGRCSGSQSPTVGTQAFISYSLGHELNVVFMSQHNISFPKS